MASEVEHRQRVARSGGGGGNVNNNNNNSSVGVVTASSKPPRRNRPPQLVARSATDRFWGLLNGEPGVPSPVSAVGAPSPLFLDAAEASEDDDEEEEEGGSSNVASPITSPPYWTTNAHTRSVSNTSVESFLPAGAITLQDNENDDDSGSNVYGRDRNRACWAKSVQVTDFVIVNGSATNIGAFVVWNIKVETLNVCAPPTTVSRPEPLFRRKAVAMRNSMSRLTVIRVSGLVHEHLQAILRIRRPQGAPPPDFPQLQSRHARTAAQERHIEIPA